MQKTFLTFLPFFYFLDVFILKMFIKIWKFCQERRKTLSEPLKQINKL